MKKFFATALAVFMMTAMPVMAQNDNEVSESVEASIDNTQLMAQNENEVSESFEASFNDTQILAQNKNIVSKPVETSFNNAQLTEAVATKTLDENVFCKNEVSASVGYGNVMQFGTAFFGALFGQKSKVSEYTINASYNHRLGRRVSVGATFSYFKGLKDTDTRYDNFYCIMPQIKVDYMNNKYVTLYGKLAIGMMINDKKEVLNGVESKDTYVHGAFQISPFGVEAGPNKHFRAFAEVGCGMEGYVQAGLRYKF